MHQVPSSNQIERRLTTLFPSTALEDHAEAVGVIEREGKLQIPPLVWSFAFGFATGESRTLAAFRRSYNSTADESLSPGGYYQRLTPSLAEYLRDLVENFMTGNQLLDPTRETTGTRDSTYQLRLNVPPKSVLPDGFS